MSDSARTWSETAPKKSPPLNSPKSKMSGVAACHSRSVLIVLPAVADDGAVERARPSRCDGLAAIAPDHAAVRPRTRQSSGTSTVSPARATSHGSGGCSQLSGCSTWEPSWMSWRKIPYS